MELITVFPLFKGFLTGVYYKEGWGLIRIGA